MTWRFGVALFFLGVLLLCVLLLAYRVIPEKRSYAPVDMSGNSIDVFDYGYYMDL